MDPENPVVGKTTFEADDVNHLYKRYGEDVNSLLYNVYQFMNQGGQLRDVKFGSDPGAPHRKRRRQWLAGKNVGEVGEFIEADFSNDIVEYIDGTIDVSYIAFGGLLEACEGNLYVSDLIIKEVCRSNETKLIDMTIGPDGKIKKGPHFEPPRVKAILEFFGYDIPKPNEIIKGENVITYLTNQKGK